MRLPRFNLTTSVICYHFSCLMWHALWVYRAHPAMTSLHSSQASMLTICLEQQDLEATGHRQFQKQAVASCEACREQRAPRSKTVHEMAAAGAILAMSGSSPLYRPRTPAQTAAALVYRASHS